MPYTHKSFTKPIPIIKCIYCKHYLQVNNFKRYNGMLTYGWCKIFLSHTVNARENNKLCGMNASKYKYNYKPREILQLSIFAGLYIKMFMSIIQLNNNIFECGINDILILC